MPLVLLERLGTAALFLVQVLKVVVFLHFCKGPHHIIRLDTVGNDNDQGLLVRRKRFRETLSRSENQASHHSDNAVSTLVPCSTADPTRHREPAPNLSQTFVRCHTQDPAAVAIRQQVRSSAVLLKHRDV